MFSPNYVFLSYSSKDQEFVKKIVELIESMGIEYWKAPEKIPAGSSYAKEIVNAIDNCSLFLIILSENSQSSIWVEKEVDCALSSSKKVIPYNIDGSSLNKAFKFYLNNVQMIIHTPNSKKSIDELIGFLRPLQPEFKKMNVKKIVSTKMKLQNYVYSLNSGTNKLPNDNTNPIFTPTPAANTSLNTKTERKQSDSEKIEKNIPIEHRVPIMSKVPVIPKVTIVPPDPPVTEPDKIPKVEVKTEPKKMAKTEINVEPKKIAKAEVKTEPVKTAKPENVKSEKEKIDKEQDVSSNKKPRKYQRGMTQKELWSLNRVPTNCMYCGGSVTPAGDGVYVCDECHAENYDDFRTIHDYLAEHGPRSVYELSSELGIPINIIKDWQRSK
ncbi:MAG: TIR domain-containing protein [Lachnospiraceae bacterium]|nr:TIR domain-containing protein [Lachnospiraceae bacterium]